MSSLLRASVTTPGEKTRQRRIIKIRVLRNGDASFPGVVMRLEPQKYASLDAVLADVADCIRHSVFIPTSGVRHLFSVAGQPVRRVLELLDGDSYVAACSGERFREAHYCLPSFPDRPGSAASASSGRCKSLCSESSDRRMRASSGAVTARRITVIREGPSPRRVYRLLLNHRNAVTFDKLLATISDLISLDSGPMHTIFTQSGNRVKSIEDFFGHHYIFFAFHKKTQFTLMDFQLNEEEIERINKLNKIPGSEALILKLPTFSGSEDFDEISPQIRMKYIIGPTIGTGRFSTVKECYVKAWNDVGEKLAMKIIFKHNDNFKNLLNEVSILKGLRHPNIVRLHYVHDAACKLYLVTELLSEGDLCSALKATKLPEREVRCFVRDIASGLFYIHCLMIAHRDVRPANLMITRAPGGRRTLKLIDFGHACKSHRLLYDCCGCTFFMAPEMLRAHGYDHGVDVWAAGVILYFMLVQVPPFLGENEEEDRRMILRGELDLSSEVWQSVSSGARELIVNMLCADRFERYSAEEVLTHPWIAGNSVGAWEDEGADDEWDDVGDGESEGMTDDLEEGTNNCDDEVDVDCNSLCDTRDEKNDIVTTSPTEANTESRLEPDSIPPPRDTSRKAYANETTELAIRPSKKAIISPDKPVEEEQRDIANTEREEEWRGREAPCDVKVRRRRAHAHDVTGTKTRLRSRDVGHAHDPRCETDESRNKSGDVMKIKCESDGKDEVQIERDRQMEMDRLEEYERKCCEGDLDEHEQECGAGDFGVDSDVQDELHPSQVTSDYPRENEREERWVAERRSGNVDIVNSVKTSDGLIDDHEDDDVIGSSGNESCGEYGIGREAREIVGREEESNMDEKCESSSERDPESQTHLYSSKLANDGTSKEYVIRSNDITVRESYENERICSSGDESDGVEMNLVKLHDENTADGDIECSDKDGPSGVGDSNKNAVRVVNTRELDGNVINDDDDNGTDCYLGLGESDMLDENDGSLIPDDEDEGLGSDNEPGTEMDEEEEDELVDMEYEDEDGDSSWESDNELSEDEEEDIIPRKDSYDEFERKCEEVLILQRKYEIEYGFKDEENEDDNNGQVENECGEEGNEGYEEEENEDMEDDAEEIDDIDKYDLYDEMWNAKHLLTRNNGCNIDLEEENFRIDMEEYETMMGLNNSPFMGIPDDRTYRDGGSHGGDEATAQESGEGEEEEEEWEGEEEDDQDHEYENEDDDDAEWEDANDEV